MTTQKTKGTKQALVKAGQLDLLQEIGKGFAPPTRSQEKLIEVGAKIRQEPDAVEKAYLARELVQCTLPHSDPGDVPLWTRTNKYTTLVVARTAFDFKSKKPIGYPYGALPRLLLFWMNTEAVRTHKRRLEMGDSFAAFIRQLGLDPSRGGLRSDPERLREQMRRLFSAAIGFQQDTDDGTHEQAVTMSVTSSRELWWDPKNPEQMSLLGSWIELGDKFFQTITATPVPGDLRGLKALKRSPLALDLYIWATYKAFSARKKGKNQFVLWSSLIEQFGADYNDPKNFRKKAIAALRKVQTVYPGLKLQDAVGGICVLASSSPAVRERPSRPLLES
jgi:hypothetical protein